MRHIWALVLVGLVLSSPVALAQERLDVGLMLGTTKTTDEGAALQFKRERTWQATLAWYVWSGDRVRLAIELPFLAAPAFEVTTSGNSLPLEYAWLSLTPGVRVVLPVREGTFSVFGTVGGGYARYSESVHKVDGSPNPNQRDTNTGAFHVGGGVDARGFGWLGFRAEIRDVITGPRNFSVPTPGSTVHNIASSGGLVVRF